MFRCFSVLLLHHNDPSLMPVSRPHIVAWCPYSSVHGAQMPRLSAASLAFAEVLIAEMAIRNRERIKLILPLLLEHYR